MSQGGMFCSKCGAGLRPGSAFCAACGVPVTPIPPASARAQRPSNWREARRQERWERRRQRREMRGGRDLAGALAGGLVLILLGSLLFLGQNNLLSLTTSNWWAYFIMSVGVIVIIQGMVRYGQRGYFMGSFIGGAILIAVGLTGVVSSFTYLWPPIIIVLAFAVIAMAVVGRGRAVPRYQGLS